MKKDNKNSVGGGSSNIPKEMDFEYFSPLEVKVYNNFDRAFKLFRSLVQAEKVLSIYKEKQSYEKPSEKKRRKHNENMQRLFEAEMKQQKIMSGEYEKEKKKKLLKKEKKKVDKSKDNE